ncbi:unnamed protein product [Haemonchus placei]|uniref:Alpha-1,3/1,6-mannosyltransferase ALG2 n=1 Tax=Haemonchus placei TaxID=6290 RepID=A0A3P7VB66_HAEPC|nr:unnamed protein product [Haemonchus placei]
MRYVLDSIEEFSTGLADVICVNSLFTAAVVRKTFKSLHNRELSVLYPTLNTNSFDDAGHCDIPELPSKAKHIFLSLNRFEVKKNVKLAIEAFAALRLMLSEDEFSSCHLIVAGGYDRLNFENITHFEELVKCASDMADEEKASLLRCSRAVLYTPHNEHFGIVPVEAMYVGTPVIAVNSGGPTESIVHGETGFLADQTPQAFAQYMFTLIRDEDLREKMTEMLFEFLLFCPPLYWYGLW